MIPVLLPVYRRSDIRIARGEGVYLYSPEGEEYLDFGSGIAVNSLGHCHPKIVEALKRQAETLWHCSNLYQLPIQYDFAEKLVAHSPMDTVFFTNSGAEAVECAIKMVRRYYRQKGNAERYRIVTVEGSFHGRTMATISAASKDPALNGFGPPLPGFDLVPFNDMEAMKRAITPQTAGIMLETIQGEGGVRAAEPGYLRRIRQLCDEQGLLLVLDEVQCGYGRTGHFYCFEEAGITPDIIALAKGIGSGYPLGACLATEEAASGMTPGSHGSTYAGNPLGMAVGLAVLEEITKDGFLDHVSEMGRQLKRGLQALVKEYPDLLADVRGLGLLLGLVTKVPNSELVEAFRRERLLTVPAQQHVIRILPPLVIEPAHIEEALHKMRQACESLRRQHAETLTKDHAALS